MDITVNKSGSDAVAAWRFFVLPEKDSERQLLYISGHVETVPIRTTKDQQFNGENMRLL
jgi:hypothetical protein